MRKAPNDLATREIPGAVALSNEVFYSVCCHTSKYTTSATTRLEFCGSRLRDRQHTAKRPPLDKPSFDQPQTQSGRCVALISIISEITGAIARNRIVRIKETRVDG